MATEEQKSQVSQNIQVYTSLMLKRSELRKKVQEAEKEGTIDGEGANAIISLVSLNQRIEDLGEAIQKNIDEWGVTKEYIKGVGRLMVKEG